MYAYITNAYLGNHISTHFVCWVFFGRRIHLFSLHVVVIVLGSHSHSTVVYLLSLHFIFIFPYICVLVNIISYTLLLYMYN